VWKTGDNGIQVDVGTFFRKSAKSSEWVTVGQRIAVNDAIRKMVFGKITVDEYDMKKNAEDVLVTQFLKPALDAQDTMMI
jgi:endonuclease V-like protein UPF0215 family